MGNHIIIYKNMKVTCLNLVGLNLIHKGIKVYLKLIQCHTQIYSVKDYFAIPLPTILEALSRPRTPVYVHQHGQFHMSVTPETNTELHNDAEGMLRT